MQKNDGNRNNNISVSTQKHEEDILYIGERPFRKIKLGLAENEVRSYIEELISQREALRKRLEPLAALTELAEKTVIDANDQSQADAEKSRRTRLKLRLTKFASRQNGKRNSSLSKAKPKLKQLQKKKPRP